MCAVSEAKDAPRYACLAPQMMTSPAPITLNVKEHASHATQDAREPRMKTVGAFIVLTLAGCASYQPYQPLEWSSLGTGCHSRGLSEVLFLPDDLDAQISLTDIRIGRLPDTGRGPGLLAHFRRHLDGPLGQSTGEPELFLAVGDWKKSCALLIKQNACPVAREIYESISSKSIPIGHAFHNPRPLQVMHGDTYFLSVRDGHGNQTNWSYHGRDHPLREAISAALDSLEACAEPAALEFSRMEL